jgi:hypothetical protein
VRAEEGNLIVSPAEKLSATLRAQLAEQKEAVLDILSPSLLDAPRTVLKRLEKALHANTSEPAVVIFFFEGARGTNTYMCGQWHDDAAIARAKQHALARAQENDWDEAWVWIGTPNCDACRAPERGAHP